MGPGIGLPELLVLAILALVVVGPRDLPLMTRKIGRFVGKMRSMAFEFRRNFDEMGTLAEFEELKKEVTDIKSGRAFMDIKKDINAAAHEAVRGEVPEPEAAKPASKPAAEPAKPSAS
ncbi:MAG: Sec-independent protein translocase protein TatB [Maricaulaceae bacterium]